MKGFEKVKKNFGFGCMRLPMNGDQVDKAAFTDMVDRYMTAGFNYFDTARVYIGGQSETAIRDCVTARYPRESFVLADKLSSLFEREEDIRPLFESQLASCGVKYFDFYLMHAQNRNNFVKYCQCRAYEQAFELKKEGKIRHVGLSFHDTADILDRILTQYPAVEFVQIQLNYIDFEDPSVQSRKCYEVCRRHGKPVIVMEPVKGGTLANLPKEAESALHALGDGYSPANYAIRFAAGFEGILTVLSGMSNVEQMEDNLRCMKEFRPLNAEEKRAIAHVGAVLKGKHLIPCTACRYCTDGCPRHIAIPDLFACLNAKQIYQERNADAEYRSITAEKSGKASACIGCGKCEKACPQHLPIRELLREAAKEFESDGSRK